MDMEKVLLLAEMATYTCYLDSSRTQVAETKDFRLELDLRFGSWVLRTIFIHVNTVKLRQMIRKERQQ